VSLLLKTTTRIHKVKRGHHRLWEEASNKNRIKTMGIGPCPRNNLTAEDAEERPEETIISNRSSR
jgi:hypothetical protein